MLAIASDAGRRTRRTVLIALLTCLVALSMSASALADVAPPERVLSQFETYWGASVERDCGFSQPIGGGKALWLFCDTQVYKLSGEKGEFIAGATAAEGAYEQGEVPTRLTEVPEPPASLSSYPFNAGPKQFLPPPGDVHAPGGGSCAGHPHTYAASWPSGLTTVPGTSTLLVVYDEVCVYEASPTIEGLAIREYNPSTNTLTSPYEIFKPSASGAALPAAKRLGSPIFSEGFFYMFAGACQENDKFGDCTRGGAVYLMGTLGGRSYYTNPAEYQWETSSGWSKSSSSAASIINGAAPENPAAVTVNSYSGKGLAMITELNIGGAYQMWLAPNGNPSAGHWSAGPSAKELHGCSGGSGQELDFCRALTGHPEISNSSDILMSYFDPEKNHDYVVAVPW